MLAHFFFGSLPFIFNGALVLLCMAAHECGHILAARCYQVSVKRIGLNWLGPYIQRSRTLGWPEVSICLAGVAMNLLLALAFWNVSRWFAVCNLTFGWVNVVPLPHSDGRHALSALRAMFEQASA